MYVFLIQVFVEVDVWRRELAVRETVSEMYGYFDVPAEMLQPRIVERYRYWCFRRAESVGEE